MNKTIHQIPSSLFSFSLILIVGVLLLIGVYGCQQNVNHQETIANKETTNENNTALSKKFVAQKPFAAIQEAIQEVVIDAPNQAQRLDLKDGAYIKIPAYAFRTAAGDTVRQPVRLTYTGMHNIASIIASGIPMQYTHEDGTIEWMKTGGMFAIEGHTTDGPVQLLEGKTMEVSFVSDKPGTFDFWRFNKAANNWDNLAQDQVPEREVIKDEALEQEIQSLERATSRAPQAPEEQSTKLIFTDLNLAKTPELQGKSPLSLVYAGTDKSKDPKETGILDNNKQWYKKEINPLGNGTYELILYGEERHIIPVKVALGETDLAKAKARYRQLLAAYNQKIELLGDKKALRQQQQAFRRTIAVANMGIHNFDVLKGKGGALSLNADFNFGETYNAVKSEIPVYLVTGQQDMVLPISTLGWRNFWFNPSWDNQLVAVLPGDKVATFSKKDFEQAKDALRDASGGAYTFEMEVQDERINTVADLQSVLSGDLEARGVTTTSTPPAIKLFPNPAVDRINVDLSSLSGKSGSLRLFNNAGQMVKELPIGDIGTEPIAFEFGQVASGPYYLTVIADNRSLMTEKVIVQ